MISFETIGRGLVRRERAVTHLRDGQPKSPAEVARLFGIPRERIRPPVRSVRLEQFAEVQ